LTQAEVQNDSLQRCRISFDQQTKRGADGNQQRCRMNLDKHARGAEVIKDQRRNHQEEKEAKKPPSKKKDSATKD